MTENLYSIYENTQNLAFLYKGQKYTKTDFDKKIAILEKNFLALFKDIKQKRVYIDIKDRFLFLTTFFTMKKLDLVTVLIPIEIQPQLFFESGIIYISDNKHHEKGIFLSDDLSLQLGTDFRSEEAADFDNLYDLYFFTSGSTGKSKNIGKWSSNVITELKELQRIFSPQQGDVFFCIPPIYHIYGFLFTLLPIFSSAVLDLNSFFTPESIAEYVAENKIDYFVSVPSYYSLFNSLNLIDSFVHLKGAFSSSGPLPGEISKKFFEKKVRIHEIYGSTETGGMAYRVFAENPDYQLFQYVKILNYDQGKEMELFISSPAISVEYDKSTGYCTGDVVQFLDEGRFTLLGRNTRFVKIHGKRVDLGFVAANFRRYLKDFFQIELGEDKVFVGCLGEEIYLLAEYDGSLDLLSIGNELKKILPGYAIPKKILLRKIPRNEMGKINKVAIEAMVGN